MRRPQLLFDGLWRCLCPAFDRSALCKAVQTPIPSRALEATARHATRQSWTQKRRFGNETIATACEDQRKNFQDASDREDRLGRNLDEVLLAPTPPTEATLQRLSTEELVMAMKKIRDPEGFSIHGQQIDRHRRIIQFVEHLVKKRGVPANTFMYECMMDAMIDPQGSARAIRALLQNMEEQGLSPTATVCQSALTALTVHPDYAMRQQVLDTMQEYWFTIDKAARQNILLGLLRDGQYEMAYDKLMDQVEAGGHIDLWVYDVFIMVFGHQRFLDEMLQLFFRRKQAKGSDNVFLSLTYYVLDVCSSASHYQGTIFAWNSSVRNGQLRPSDGMLENVLTTASREGDVELTTEVHSMISNRSRVQIHHYETLIEAFVRGQNIAGALRILCIMEQNGLAVLREHTRAVYQTLRHNRPMAEEAETIIRDMAKDRPVPLGVISVVLEATSKNIGSDAAKGLYDDVERLSGEQPSATMIQDMIINSNKKWDNIRDFLEDYKEKIPKHEKPPLRVPAAYSKLISVCLDFGELGLAFRFANNALLPKPSRTQNPTWLKALAERAIQAEDNRIWQIVDKFKEVGNKEAVASIQRVFRVMRAAREGDKRNQDAVTTVEADADGTCEPGQQHPF